jgi:hypothetical protein
MVCEMDNSVYVMRRAEADPLSISHPLQTRIQDLRKSKIGFTACITGAQTTTGIIITKINQLISTL